MTQKSLLPLLLIGLLLMGGFLWKSMEQGPGEGPGGLEADAAVSAPAVRSAPTLNEPARTLRQPTLSEGSTQTTVVLPLEIELELVTAKPRLSDPSVPDLDSAATAKIRGSMHLASGAPARGYVEFVAGPNTGRTLETDSEGRFGANDLYAGLSLVTMVAAGTPGAQREVLLRENRDAQLNVGFGRSSVVHGLVKDSENVPLPNAKVVMDGQKTMTDKDGRFYFARMGSGKVPLYISKPGYASHREMQFITGGMNIPPGKLRFNLRKGATLRVVIPERIGGPGPGQLHLTGPLDGKTGRTYPWHLKSPIEVFGGESIEIEDLPAGRIRLQYFRSGAVSTPKQVLMSLSAGVTKTATIHLESAPSVSGRVLQDGQPVEGALVQLEMPDVSGAAAKAMGGHMGRVQLEVDVYAQMPPAKQKMVSRGDGSFHFSAAEEFSGVRYLTARSRDGRSWGGKVVKTGEYTVDIELSSATEGDNSLVLETSTRFQALPVRYSVNGKPFSTILRATERLTIDDLPEGRWRITARWRNDTILNDVLLEVDGEEELFLPLPQGAIDGQSKSTPDAMQ